MREVGERLSVALPSLVPVSISACEGNTQKQHLHFSGVCAEQPDSLMPLLRQHSQCVLDKPSVCLSGNVDSNQLNMFSLVLLSSRLLTLFAFFYIRL